MFNSPAKKAFCVSVVCAAWSVINLVALWNTPERWRFKLALASSIIMVIFLVIMSYVVFFRRGVRK